MKTGLLIAATVGTASAQQIKWGPYNSRTWCGPSDGMYETQAKCEAAANTLHMKFASAAGNEWHAGCLVQNDKEGKKKVYYSPLTTDGTHEQSTNGGYLCKRKIAVKLSDEFCSATNGMIESEMECQDAAAQEGLTYKAVAGNNWEQGCIHHNAGGGVYFVEGAGGKDAPDSGFLCHQPSQCYCKNEATGKDIGTVKKNAICGIPHNSCGSCDGDLELKGDGKHQWCGPKMVPCKCETAAGKVLGVVHSTKKCYGTSHNSCESCNDGYELAGTGNHQYCKAAVVPCKCENKAGVSKGVIHSTKKCFGASHNSCESCIDGHHLKGDGTHQWCGKCKHKECGDWSCADWCQCFDASKESVYVSNGCSDDGLDSCNCNNE